MAVDLQKEHGGGSLDCSLDGLRNNYPAYEALQSQNYGKNMRFLIISLWMLIFLSLISVILEGPQQQQPSLIHPILPSCQSSGEHAHMLSLVVSFQGRVHAVVGIGMPLGIAAQALMNWLWPFTPTFNSLTPPSLFSATWSSHIYHSQLKWQKTTGKCRWRGAIIHAA